MKDLISEIIPPLWRGLFIGFVLAVPVGPVGILTIRRAIARGIWAGFIAGLGAATADIFYGLVAAFGITVIISALTEHRAIIELVGGIILVILGVVIIRSHAKISEDEKSETSRGFVATYFSSFVIAIANPATVFAFLGVFATLGPGLRALGKSAPPILVAGVFLGSAAWWLLLSYLAALLGKKLTARGLKIMNIISGSLLLALGLWQFIQLARKR